LQTPPQDDSHFIRRFHIDCAFRRLIAAAARLSAAAEAYFRAASLLSPLMAIIRQYWPGLLRQPPLLMPPEMPAIFENRAAITPRQPLPPLDAPADSEQRLMPIEPITPRRRHAGRSAATAE